MSLSARKAVSSHSRQLSRVSSDRPLEPQPQSSDDRPVSSKASKAERERERRYTVTVNESFARDGVLLNLDLVARDLKPGTLVAINVTKSEAERLSQNPSQKQQFQDRAKDGSSPGAAAKAAETERPYIFSVKDMPKDLKARYPTVEVYVPRDIADAFGMKKGSQVVLAPVRLVSSNPIASATYPPVLVPMTPDADDPT